MAEPNAEVDRDPEEFLRVADADQVVYYSSARPNSEEQLVPAAPVKQPTSNPSLLILLTFCASHFCISLCYALIMPFFPQEAARKGGNAKLSGLTLASYEIAMLFMAPLISRVMARAGGKLTLISGVFVVGVCNILFGLLDRVSSTTAFFVLSIATRILEGVGAIAYFIASMTLRTSLFSSYLALAFALIEAMFSLGLAIGPAVGGALYSWGGYSLPFFMLGAVLLAINFLQVFTIPGETLRKNKPAAESIAITVENETTSAEARIVETPTMIKFFLQPSISFSFFSLMTGSFALTFLNSILSFHLLPIVGNAAHVGYISFTLGLGELFAGPPAGYFQDHGGSSRLVLCFAFLFEFIGFVIIGPTPLLPFMSTSIPLVITGCVLIGAGNGCFFTAPFKLALEAVLARGFPKSEDTYAILSTCSLRSFSLGATLGPIVGGALQDRIGFRWAVTCVTALPMIMLIISLVRLVRHRRSNRIRPH